MVSNKEIVFYLLEKGVSARTQGFNYLTEALRLTLSDIDYTRLITKRLYIDVGRKYNTSGTNVERGMRTALKNIDPPMTNGEFIRAATFELME